MRALSVWQPWASLIAGGEKTIEIRSWECTYRGPLLICSSKKPDEFDLPLGMALAIVDLVDCRRFREEDEGPSMIVHEFLPEALEQFAWVLSNVRQIKQVPVRGKQGLFFVPDEIIEVIGD